MVIIFCQIKYYRSYIAVIFLYMFAIICENSQISRFTRFLLNFPPERRGLHFLLVLNHYSITIVYGSGLPHIPLVFSPRPAPSHEASRTSVPAAPYSAPYGAWCGAFGEPHWVNKRGHPHSHMLHVWNIYQHLP